jgi:hypothetical protein
VSRLRQGRSRRSGGRGTNQCADYCTQDRNSDVPHPRHVSCAETFPGLGLDVECLGWNSQPLVTAGVALTRCTVARDAVVGPGLTRDVAVSSVSEVSASSTALAEAWEWPWASAERWERVSAWPLAPAWGRASVGVRESRSASEPPSGRVSAEEMESLGQSGLVDLTFARPTIDAAGLEASIHPIPTGLTRVLLERLQASGSPNSRAPAGWPRPVDIPDPSKPEGPYPRSEQRRWTRLGRHRSPRTSDRPMAAPGPRLLRSDLGATQ